MQVFEMEDLRLIETEEGKIQIDRKGKNEYDVVLAIFDEKESKQIRYLFDRLFCSQEVIK